MEQTCRGHHTGSGRAGVILLALALAAGSLAGCGQRDDLPVIENGTGGTGEDIRLPDGSLVTLDTAPDAGEASVAQTGSYDAASVTAVVTLTGDGATVSGSGVSVSGSVVTFTSAGTYLISGDLADGQLIVATADATADTEKVRLVLAGDLQAQCTASGYAMRELGVPFAGVFGACSTMAETLGLGAALCASGAAEHLLAMASSHFCAAERQFRTPLEYGGKRTPTAQWTATSAGACLVRGSGAAGVPVLSATIGRVCDAGVKDINNMGAAMAPAAAQTLLHYFAGTGTTPQDFDAIFTGDLGEVGSTLLHELMHKADCPVENHQDCGCLLYDVAAQNVQAGGSGAGCSAAVLAAHVLPGLVERRWRRVLFLSTGALMSQTTFLQGESIPGIAHCVELGCPEEEGNT